MDTGSRTPDTSPLADQQTSSEPSALTAGSKAEPSTIRDVPTSRPDQDTLWRKISPNERQAWIAGGFAIATAIVGVGTAIYIHSSTRTEIPYSSPQGATSAMPQPAASPSPSALASAIRPSEEDCIIIDLNNCGLPGLREDISPVAVMQRYGFPKNPEQLDYLEYPTFAVYFDDKSQLTHVRFDWKSSAHWKTTTGLGFNATKSDVLEIYGEPKEVLYSEGSFYYDRFSIEFDSSDHISVITLRIRDTGGLTVAAVEREALRLMMVDPQLKKISTEHPEIGTMLAFYSLTLRKSKKDSNDIMVMKEFEKALPKEAQLVKKRFLSERTR